jgi:hypothetical protein
MDGVSPLTWCSSGLVGTEESPLGGWGGVDTTDGGTTVASETWLNDRCRRSWTGAWVLAVSLGAGVSSASSAISISLRRRRELEEEVIEPEAVCKRHADESALSVSSDGFESEKTVSWGENLSSTDWN